MNVPSTQYIFLLIIIAVMLPRVVITNNSIARTYKIMSVEMSDAVAITDKTRSAFKGFFTWCSRTHHLMSLMAIGHVFHWILLPSELEGALVVIEMSIMLTIHTPERRFGQEVLDRFFSVDLMRLEQAIAVGIPEENGTCPN